MRKPRLSLESAVSVGIHLNAGACLRIVCGLFLCVLTICVSARSSLAQAPGWSRGIQSLGVSFDECTSRARRGLAAEGYKLENQGGSFNGDYYFAGYKGPHSAVIACNASADGRTWANVFVASSAQDGERERLRLQAQMERPGGGGGGGGGGGTAIGWADSPVQYNRGKNGARVTYSCPRNGDFHTIWGWDIYTDDSSVCTAAVHVGLISYANGGTVTIEIRPGQQHYNGGSRNRVDSREYGGFAGSYVFVR